MESKVLKEIHRSMVKHFLDKTILAELKNAKALSGYDIIELVHRKYGFLLSSGTVYTLLYSMERKGLIKGKYTEGKRTYVLSNKGKYVINAIKESKAEIQRFVGTLF